MAFTADLESRLRRLVWDFDRYIQHYTARATRISRHAEAIARVRSIGTTAAITDETFLGEVSKTLNSWSAWRPIPKGQNAPSPDDISRALQTSAPTINGLAVRSLEDRVNPVGSAEVWTLISAIPTFGKSTRIVSHTKLLHHLLPDLVAPIDNEYTCWFLGLETTDMSRPREARTFGLCFQAFQEIAIRATPSQYVDKGSPWNSSLSKVIDNAIGGYKMLEKS
jgi:hypothetical protein